MYITCKLALLFFDISIIVYSLLTSVFPLAFVSSSGIIKESLIYIYIYIYIYIRGSLNKFPDFFQMGTFIDSTHMKL